MRLDGRAEFSPALAASGDPPVLSGPERVGGRQADAGRRAP
jgi:hypothetical protein